MNKPYFCRNFFLTDWRHKRLKNTIDLLLFYREQFYGFSESECSILEVFSQSFILSERSWRFWRNDQHFREKTTSQRTYVGHEICSIDGNWPRAFQQRCLEKIQCSKKHPVHVEKKNREKIIAAFKSSGGTKRQRIKEGRYEQVNVVCCKWLLNQRSENIPINGTTLQKKAPGLAKQLNIEKFLVSDD